MFAKLLTKVFGSHNQREIKRLQAYVNKVNALEPEFSKLEDSQLQAKTAEFKQRLEKGETLDQLLPEAFATVREAGKRVLGMRHYDVQLIGGAVLHEGKIAEMRTGEGKTLVSTLPAYLNALTGKGVHIVTVNDYLAGRDAEWMGRIHTFLGLSVGVIKHNLLPHQRREAYGADITYGTNNEFGFDYLRDNMTFHSQDKVQRGLSFAIIDEVDSILIDEARTPLIISGPVSHQSEIYIKVDQIFPKLVRQEKEDTFNKLNPQEVEENPGDYFVDEKNKQIYLSEQGHEHVEQLLNEIGLLPEGASLYDLEHINLMHHVQAAIKANALFTKDVDYVVENGQVVIVDEFTGRKMEGRRWSEGLHQAVEAKEGVKIKEESQTLASITFQNYFRIYNKLGGMTGTADTEAFEFKSIYALDVLVIPTHRPMVRKDMGDLVYLDQASKYQAIIEDIQDCMARNQPVLVGTASIEASELLSALLKKDKIKHEVLNAKQHAREAEIIAQAGKPGSVTIATNMAGRGTDIILGGNLEMEMHQLGKDPTPEAIDALKQAWQEHHEQVLKAGGLHVIGTERHESRRIDNQLRGRSGRQGDPGSSRFYVSLQDNLMRIFGSDRTAAILQKVGMKAGEAIEHPWISGAIENAQKKVEGHNFDIRKNLLEYDDVANQQRMEVYSLRDELLLEEVDLKERIDAIIEDIIGQIVEEYIPLQSLEEQWNLPALESKLNQDFHIQISVQDWLTQEPELPIETIYERITKMALDIYADKDAQIGRAVMGRFERAVMLQILDQHWKEHLAAIDYLRQSINLYAYGQKNPKQEYKRESFAMFGQMLEMIKYEVASIVLKVQIQTAEEVKQAEEKLPQQPTKLKLQHDEVDSLSGQSEKQTASAQQAKPATVVRDKPKIGRNDPCYCGSGKKYKHCHGKQEETA